MRTPPALDVVALRMAAFVLLPFCCGGCYSHQMLPETTICAHDQQGRPVAGLSGKWSGSVTEGDVPEQPFGFGSDGCAHVAKYDMPTNALSFVGGVMTIFIPHPGRGVRGPLSEVRVSLPDAYEVDEAASGLKRTGNTASGGGPVWEGPDDRTTFYSALWTGHPNGFVISLSEPGSRPSLQVRLVLRRKATTLPVTGPANR